MEVPVYLLTFQKGLVSKKRILSVATAAVIGVCFMVLGVVSGCSSDETPPPVDPGDQDPPDIIGAATSTVDEITMSFSEPLDKASAEDVANYIVVKVAATPVSPAALTAAPAGAVEVISALLQKDGMSVLLSTERMSICASYEIEVRGVADESGNRIEDISIPLYAAFEVDPACGNVKGYICTWAGTGKIGYDGGDNPLLESFFYQPIDMEFTSSGTYILDWNNHIIRRVTLQNTLERVIGTGFVGDGDDALSDTLAPGPAATDVHLNHPTQLIELPNGKILLSAWHNHKLREYDPATGKMFVLCGRGAGFEGDGGPIGDARLNQPTQTVVAQDGALYILGQRNQRVRKIHNGIITTVVGTGVAGFSGDNGPPLDAQINMPSGNNPPVAGALALDSQDRLYISDALNNRIRRVDFGQNIIETVAGDGNAGYSGDGGDATAASLNNPLDIEIGPDGRLYIADEYNHAIRVVDLDTGIISTIAGSGDPGFCGDGGPTTHALLNRPSGIAFGNDGNLYIVDRFNHRIRRVNM